MFLVTSISGIPIRITEERWSHILKNHPEMKDGLNDVLETVRNPIRLQLGDSGELLAISYNQSSNKFLVVAYRELSPTDGFVLTAYIARRLSLRRTTVWMP